MKTGTVFALVTLAYLLSAGLASAETKAKKTPGTKTYNISCRVKDAYSQPKDEKSDLIEAELSGAFLVNGDHYELINVSSYYFTYDKDYTKSIREAKRPTDSFTSFGYYTAPSLKNDAKYSGDESEARKYPNHLKFDLTYDGLPWGDIQSAEFKFPKVAISKADQKDVEAVINLHFDQNWALVQLKCSVSLQGD